ncbi:Reticulocyte-binding protein 2 a [Madurella mycetomatis]|uniref:Reticulocyte-binding protein 2 a n=1 Tax=Madurella mycetomatis TaxID=100816 RepID=A0A175VXW3_9PEZI|nr:Reticulocyte-binding protein 2 a [Madurella mycetomatis]
MDAQNAAEPASTKPAASPKRPGSDTDHPRAPAVAKSSGALKTELSFKDGRPIASASRTNDDDGGADGNSDAETIVLPGKDGHSPSKVRKIIKHEDKSDAEDAASASFGRKPSNLKQDCEGDRTDRGDRADKLASVTGTGSNDSAASLVGKKKKHLDKSKIKDGSSGLSSAPASPPQPQRRRRPSNARSDSETAHVDSPKTSTKEKPKSLDKVVPHKRKAPRPDSEDEAENRKVRRQRTSGSGLDASRKQHLPSKAHHEPHSLARNRSISPHSRAHRRSISTQLPAHSSNGLSQKKKRIPAPLQSTDYLSDESSASGSPHPRSSKLRGLATPATAESTISPAKMAPHKKHLDAHGQTFLARACAKGEYETAKQRLQERPEDINVADYAGNTPLQIAALNGFDDIVRLLVNAGCNLDCVNNDKDTPLLDAVENGHLEVVRILLDAGVNPRKANAYGQEPIDRLNDELDHADEIRRALQEAKQKMGERRRTSEEHHMDHTDARSSHGPESPRRSPGASGSIRAGGGRRAGTVRATKTSNHLLYMPMDDKTLRQAAARGDEETVTRILQVRDTFDDPESMVAAARGGHDIVMQLLLALGRANPDPAPISDGEYSTPILAAIGQENIKVIRLLLDQNDFDPTRRTKGETYYEIARRRRGPNWMEEEHMLKDAYDEYKKTHKETSKNRSPSRRDQDREPRRRADAKDDATKAPKRKASSPTRDAKKPASTKTSASPKEKRRSSSLAARQDDQSSPKRGPGRPKKEDRIPAIAISDREASPATKPVAKAKRAESDLAAASSEGETVKPRRKLVSGRELKGEREKQRRPSLTSNASSMKEPSSPREEFEKTHKTEKYHDRTKALKRDESRDRLSVSGESTGKRYRSSETPPHPGSMEKDAIEAPVKRRRLDADGKEKRPKSSHSDDRLLKAPAPRDPRSASASAGPRLPSKNREDEERRPTPKPKKTDSLLHSRRESGKSASSDSSIHVKSEDPDVEMPDAGPPVNDTSESRVSLKEKEEDEKKRRAELEAQAREARRKEEEKKRREEEEQEKERLRLEEAKRLAEAEARRREEEEQRRREEEERKRKEEEERKRREEEERRQREEEERRRLQEEERKKREEEERIRREEEERKQREEEERKKREEEERLRREQLEREAAEEARRKREEEERKEQERKERALREEMERRRAAREAERAAKEADQRRIRLEQERARLAKLPPLLRWLDGSVNPKTPEVAEKFSMMQGVRYDCICPEANGTRDGREQWLLNTQVALLLGEKDLELSRYTAWTRMPVSAVAKRVIWRLESDRYALTTPSLFELGQQLPDYYGEDEPHRMGYRTLERLRAEAWEKFAAMDMFFVKASDFMYIIPTMHHLRNVKLTMAYCELPETDMQSISWTPHQKWRSDPEINGLHGFAPSNKHFVNGELVSEDKPRLRAASSSPFRRQRIPRRGFVAVSRDDPAYGRLCKEQGLDDVMVDAESPRLPNGVHSSPMSASSHTAAATVNGLGSPMLIATTTGNGTGNQPISPSSESGPAQARPLVNGIHGMLNDNTD